MNSTERNNVVGINLSHLGKLDAVEWLSSLPSHSLDMMVTDGGVK